MAGNNLMFRNSGLDHLYLNGVPIIEARFSIPEIFKKVARISSLAVQADPYFNDKTELQKIFSESHGEGDRIQLDFLEEGAKDILPVFIPLQRLIPEGKFDLKSNQYEYLGNSPSPDFIWTNPDSENIFVNSLELRAASGYGEITIFAGSTELGTVTLPEYSIDAAEYLSYDLAGWLGGFGMNFLNWDYIQNLRNNNELATLTLVVSNNSTDFIYDVRINTSEYDKLGWVKALTELEDVKLPTYNDDIVVSYLKRAFNWINTNEVEVTGCTVRQLSGSSYVTINSNLGDGTETFIGPGDHGVQFDGDISNIEIELREPSENFSYHLIINTKLPNTLPSPRFEFDSEWNPDEIIYRWQNMDTRPADRKLDYSPNTLVDTRIDPNVYDHVKKYLFDGLQAYVLRELYRAVGYDKKYIDYARKYEMNRQYVAFWLKSDTSLQTQYHYAGV